MLIAFRLAGLPALEAHYAGIVVVMQFWMVAKPQMCPPAPAAPFRGAADSGERPKAVLSLPTRSAKRGGRATSSNRLRVARLTVR